MLLIIASIENTKTQEDHNETSSFTQNGKLPVSLRKLADM